MKNKSIKLNAVLNIISTVMSLIFPLITLPYVTRILQTESYGRVIYASSIISYFSLLAGLGTGNYALREGAAVRENKESFSRLASEIFTINIISTLCSYVLLLIIVCFVPKLHSYSGLLAIFSLEILFGTLSVSWVYKAYEEYVYITVTGVAVQLLSLVLIFLFVKEESDYMKYALIWTLSYIIPGILNIIRVRKFCKLRIIISKKIIKHLKPVFILFASSIASTIYVSSDTTVLGYICGDYYTGLYGVSSRIYSVIKNILIAALTVSIPRFSYYLNQNRKAEYTALLNKVVSVMCMLAIPMATGIFLLSKELIVFLFGESYIDATLSLQILGAAILFCMVAWIASQCILIPSRKEKLLLKATLFGGILNVTLNIILMPVLKHNAAALTTLISECAVSIIYVWNTRKEWKLRDISKHLLQCLVGNIIMIAVVLVVKASFESVITKVTLSIILGASAYFAFLLLVHNEFVYKYAVSFVSKTIEKLVRRKKRE